MKQRREKQRRMKQRRMKQRRMKQRKGETKEAAAISTDVFSESLILIPLLFQLVKRLQWKFTFGSLMHQ